MWYAYLKPITKCKIQLNFVIIGEYHSMQVETLGDYRTSGSPTVPWGMAASI